jgi:acyl dehydratase
MTVQSLTAAQVRVGDSLPSLSFDVTSSTIILGALASRDWRPMHHDVDFAVNHNGTRDIFMNTPNQAAWFERYLTDWSGPKGRLGRMKFRMKDSVFPGDTMVFSGSVESLETDDTGCSWVDVALRLRVGDGTVTECAARIALPARADDNPWKRHGDAWKP